MKKIAYFTSACFWIRGFGHHAHIEALTSYLASHTEFVLYYLGQAPLHNVAFPYEVHHFPAEANPDAAFISLAFHLQQNGYDLAIIDHFYYHWIADLLPSTTRRFLHAADLLSQRTKTFKDQGRSVRIPISEEEECSVFQKFDKVIFIQEEEAARASLWIGKDRCLVCPHPVAIDKPFPIRDTVETIGFFGSPAIANLDGLKWFHDHVLPLIGDYAKKCTVYGTITEKSGFKELCPNFLFKGVVPHIEDFYKTVDIAINPMLYGSGLKIKTVEALGYGIPLVTTFFGAEGLKEESNLSFLVADTPTLFAEALLSLACSKQKRELLSSRSYAYCLKQFNSKNCFNLILN